MNARFHAPNATAPGQELALPVEEAGHLTRVLRLGVGDAVRVFDGRGHEFTAQVTHAEREAVHVRLEEACQAAREASVAITLMQAVLKGDRMDDVVRDAVMMGVAAVQPIVTARTEVSLSTLARGRRRQRWERVAIASAKQCGRAVVPAVHEPIAVDTLVSGLGQAPGEALMLVEPSAGASVVPLSQVPSAPPPEASILVGPAGGWTEDEIAAAAGVCRLVSLGGRTLRADAMALVALAALFSRWGEY